MTPAMTQWRHPTAFSSWGFEEREAIDRVLRSGRYTMGPEVEAFEHEFAAWHGRKHGVMVNSGSSANLVAVHALAHRDRIGKHSVVGLPAIAWPTTYAPFLQLGAYPWLMDCDDTWNADVGRVSTNCDVVVVCSILGNPLSLKNWHLPSRVPVIEDNCESLGAVDQGGRLCGTFGLMSTFSFFHSHQISAVEGGMVLTDDDDLAKTCRMLRAHGWSRDVETPRTFEAEYDFRVYGFNVRPIEMHAAIAREQLKKLPGFIERRRLNLDTFEEAAWDLPVTTPRPNGKQSPFGIPFTVDAGKEARARLVGALRARGIDCRLPTGGSFLKHAYGAPWRGQMTPNADLVHDTGMFIGNAPWGMDDEIAQVASVIHETLGSRDE